MHKGVDDNQPLALSRGFTALVRTPQQCVQGDGDKQRHGGECEGSLNEEHEGGYVKWNNRC